MPSEILKEEKIRKNAKEDAAFLKLAPSFLFCALFETCILLFFSKKAGLSGYTLIPLAAVFCFTSLFLYLGTRIKGRFFFAILLFFVLLSLIFIMLVPFLKSGLTSSANLFLDAFTKSSGRIFREYDNGIDDSLKVYAITAFLSAFSVPAAAFCIFLFSGRNRFLLLLLLAADALYFILFPGEADTLNLLLIFLPLPFLLFFMETEHEAKGAVHVFLLILAAAIALSLLFFAGGAADSKSKPLAGLAEKAVTSFSGIRYGSNDSYGLTGGDLTKVSSLKRSDKNALLVTMEHPQSCYLRGFTGSVYTGRSWTALANETKYPYAGLFSALHQNGFYEETQLARISLLTDSSLAQQEESVTVKNLSADRRYIYAPYETSWANDSLLDACAIGSGGLSASGAAGSSYYKFSMLPAETFRSAAISALLSEAEENPSEAVTDYLTSEAGYNNFVYSNYLEIPEKSRTLIRDGLSAVSSDASLLVMSAQEISSGKTHADYHAAKQAILSLLSAKTDYKTEVSALSEDQDFFEKFLKTDKGGYDVGYATAAVLMFRSFGIPARYAEGFLILPSDAANAENGTQISIDGAHAHAWAEYYQDGIGWIPFECTPAYIGVMAQEENVEGGYSENGYTYSNASKAEASGQQALSENEGKSPLPAFLSDLLSKAFLPLIILVLAAILLFFLVLFLKARIGFLKRKKSFQSSDLSESCASLMDYCMQLLTFMGLHLRNCSLKEYTEEVAALPGITCAEKFNLAADINERARFSKSGATESDYRKMKNFEKQLKSDADKAIGIKKRLLYFLKGQL